VIKGRISTPHILFSHFIWVSSGSGQNQKAYSAPAMPGTDLDSSFWVYFTFCACVTILGVGLSMCLANSATQEWVDRILQQHYLYYDDSEEIVLLDGEDNRVMPPSTSTNSRSSSVEKMATTNERSPVQIHHHHRKTSKLNIYGTISIIEDDPLSSYIAQLLETNPIVPPTPPCPYDNRFSRQQHQQDSAHTTGESPPEDGEGLFHMDGDCAIAAATAKTTIQPPSIAAATTGSRLKAPTANPKISSGIADKGFFHKSVLRLLRLPFDRYGTRQSESESESSAGSCEKDTADSRGYVSMA
jgi:hypothetical protein